MKPRIYLINLSLKDNYVSFDDGDSMTDYFHGYSLGINRVVEWVKKSGGRKIVVTVTNNNQEIPALKRVRQIAKAGYTVTDKCEDKTWLDYRNNPIKYFHLEWVLAANSERSKVIEAEDLEIERKQHETEAYAAIVNGGT